MYLIEKERYSVRENDRIRSIGILSYKIDSPRYTGRRSGYGNIIKVGDNIAIITAAHCVYEIGVDKFNIHELLYSIWIIKRSYSNRKCYYS